MSMIYGTNIQCGISSTSYYYLTSTGIIEQQEQISPISTPIHIST